MRSSYIENNYGDLIKNYVISACPKVSVELGVLDGYSTLHIAKGLRDINKMYGIKSNLDAYDLFGDYAYKHGSQNEVSDLLSKNSLLDYVNLIKGDAYKVYSNYDFINFLHIDISNTGKVIRDILTLWHSKIASEGLILIEGGSIERDNVEWMRKYFKESIRKEIETNEIIRDNYSYIIHEEFPSMTVLIRNK